VEFMIDAHEFYLLTRGPAIFRYRALA
jgi:hypothetical protein